MSSEVVLSTIREHAGIRPEDNFSPTDDLLEFGIDSIGLVNLILDLEDRLNIQIPDEEMLASNFSSAEALLTMIVRVSNG